MAAIDVALSALEMPVSVTGKMTRKLAIQITGGLSNPSKMPGHAWGTPAELCITGAKLRNVKGSVCENCYAMKNEGHKNHPYTWPSVQLAYQRRFDRMNDPRWVEAMVFLINDDYFRFSDSGDLQNVQQLRNIVRVCEQKPNTKFWLPTREYKIVMDFLRAGGQIPSNLVIRLSAHMKDAAPPSGYGLPTSTVHTSEENEPAGNICRAYQHKNFCGECRACWDPTVANVSYLEH